MVNKGQTPTLTSNTSLAEALRQNAANTPQEDRVVSPIEDLLARGGVTPRFDDDIQKQQYEEQKERVESAQEQAKLKDKVAPVETSVDVYIARKERQEAEDLQGQEHWRSKILALIRQKKIPTTEASHTPDEVIRQASKSNERLLAEAEKETTAYDPNESPTGFNAVFIKKQAKRRGYHLTTQVQKGLTDPESNLHSGGGQ